MIDWKPLTIPARKQKIILNVYEYRKLSNPRVCLGKHETVVKTLASEFVLPNFHSPVTLWNHGKRSFFCSVVNFIFIFFLFSYCVVPYTVFKKLGIPGPTPLPFLGNAGRTIFNVGCRFSFFSDKLPKFAILFLRCMCSYLFLVLQLNSSLFVYRILLGVGQLYNNWFYLRGYSFRCLPLQKSLFFFLFL